MTLKGQRGFTLLEVMIAIFILVIALSGLIAVTVMTIKGNDFSKRMTTATTLAKDKMEKVKNLPYDSPSLNAGTTYDYLNGDSSDGVSGAYFTRKLTVTDATPAANMKTIEVEVSWSWGGTRKVTLQTIVAS